MNLTQCLQEFFDDDQIEITLQAVHGGDIHQSAMIQLVSGNSAPKKLFVKTNAISAYEVLKSEYDSLKAIDDVFSGVYPKPILFKSLEDKVILLMTFHEISSFNKRFSAEAGRLLAQQHRIVHNKFGWFADNFIGLTPQSNQWKENWVEFFREQRLLPMLKMAITNGLDKHSAQQVEQLLDNLDMILNHDIVPSLVHGDLWSGNLGVDMGIKQPIFFDPAPYYGDREVDLAMTELFGRLPADFYQHYNSAYPIQEGYEQRKHVYNLYHALNHVVLFGSGYLGLVAACLKGDSSAL